MTSLQECLQMKKETMDKWSVRELLCLASAVCRNGDQNWISVSRAMKPFGEPNRPSDWFHQKNCAAQYATLLGNVDTPKRKKRISSAEATVDTPTDNIFQRLVAERQSELKKLLAEERNEYLKLQEDMALLQSGKVSEEQLDIWCKEIEVEEYKKEQESIAQAQWFKEREQRKQEADKVWRPTKSTSIAGQKRKNSDSLDNHIESEHVEEIQHQQQLPPPYPQTPEPAKPALSPLLTSLLKSPSQVQNSSILHTAITNRHVPNTNTNPMIASLLNSSTGVTVSPGLQQLVSTAIGQEANNVIDIDQQPLRNDILDDENLPNIKIDDLANSILVQDGPLPEIKKEEVDDIISEIIENAHDIVNDPEQHLQLDGNGDININLELDDFEEDLQETEQQQHQQQETAVMKEEIPQEQNIVEASVEIPTPITQQHSSTTPPQTQLSIAPPTVVDPFEFQEDPVIHLDQSIKVSNINKQEPRQYVPHYQMQQPPQVASVEAADEKNEHDKKEEIKKEVETTESEMKERDVDGENITQSQKEQIDEMKEEIESEVAEQDKELMNVEPETITDEVPEKSLVTPPEPPKIERTSVPGSVEIVEVNDGDAEEIDKELDKSQIQDIVHSMKLEETQDIKSPMPEPEVEKIKSETEVSSPPESKDTASIATFEESSESSDVTMDVKKEVVVQDVVETTTVTSDFTNDLYDDTNMEVKIDKSGKAKRDYSRTKKKEEKGFDMLLAIEKAQLEDSELTEENFSDNTTDTEKKDIKMKIKSETERSNSPWTEEEDNSKGGKRRYSTPGTPIDSVPNSPASSLTFNYEDDRDYKNWKKSVMLVYNRLATNKYASLFLKPITNEQAPELNFSGYSSTVFRPMDLQTIKKNIENGTIRTTLEFKRDTMLMFTNAIMYNRTNETIYNMAMQMQQESLEPIEILMLAGSRDVPLRRETRTSESCTKRKRTITDEALLKCTKKRKED
ncbi:unnamed protein product [Phaedon cochleariae]|uniref:Bromo domain-containing protein n=1 Tax=Phaedon cochleariae TaxID=80249 RepID=A0A9P0GM54_PHACE|nr:unnamed protein product [Phaedon cochleariae]